MFSKSTEPRSIAAQLVLLFTLAAALLLCSGLGVLYWIVVRHAFEEDNEVLADKIAAVRGDLSSVDGGQIVSHELNTKRAGERVSYWIRVLDSREQTVAETPGMSALLPPPVFARVPNRSGVEPQDYRARDQLFALTTTARSAAEPFTIQIAQDRSADEQFSRKFLVLLTVVLVCGIVASAVIARVFTRRSLRPLEEMIRAFQRIGPKHLQERVAPAAWPRELQPLALAYDAMLDRLEDSFTRLSQFSADLAHELRTPIANLRGEAEVALRQPRTPEEYRDVVESNVAECERLSGIIDNLLFLARAEAADGPITRTRFDGRAAIEKIAGYYETIAEVRQIAIKCTGAGEVCAESLLFSRAVSNLVDNAVRYSRDGGLVEISVRGGADAAEVSVRDDGVGIGREHLPRIFDRFYRVDSSRSSEGTGLGLALVKSIAELHGGTAKVTSEAGIGTTFTLRFPAGA
ncbi:MAG: heavy metal sensor histidine kinase [Verrucomicrobiota bacterium]|nr:heavy metal sensor histidine kinase [Verrucomicrobiota bacterium]